MNMITTQVERTTMRYDNKFGDEVHLISSFQAQNESIDKAEQSSYVLILIIDHAFEVTGLEVVCLIDKEWQAIAAQGDR